jgi:tetratricopeptide (TPR) repeat protein
MRWKSSMSRIDSRRSAWLLALLLSLNGAFAQDAAALYRQGVDLQQKGDLAAAAEAYRQSLALDPANIGALSNLGAALVGLGRFEDAIPFYSKALENAPAQYRTILQRNLALAYYKSGRMNAAAPLLIALHEAAPASHPAALLAADCLLQLGEPAKALELLEPLAPEATADRALAYVLGIAYLKNGKTADAQRVLDPILRDDSSAEGQYALGMAMFTSGDYPSAVAALRKAIALNPDLAHIQSYYGQSLIFTGDADGALAAFQKQLAADPNDYEANYFSASILLRRGQKAEAEPLLRRAALLRPDAAKATAQMLPAPTEGGLKPGAQAPVFTLAKSEGGGALRIPQEGKPTVLVFGSYTCPNFRKAAPVLNALAQKLQNQVTFLQVYIREAHAEGQWQSTINERENVELAMPTSMDQKNDYAVMCNRKLHLRFPAVVDGLDNAAEKAYSAWPSYVYVIGADGRVRYSSPLLEVDFDPKVLETAIRDLTPRR